MATAQDVILGWMVTAPEGAPDPSPDDVLCDIGDQRTEMRQRTAAICRGAQSPPLFVDMDGVTWGVAGAIRCERGLELFQGLCKLEGQEDGTDYFSLGPDADLGPAEVVLLTHDLFSAFLCRAWARQNLFEKVRPLLGTGHACPFDVQGQVVLQTDGAAGFHYLELLLGRGRRDRCPQAEKYLQGVARDMTLQQQPYLRSVLEGRATVRPEDSVLSILERLNGSPSEVPRDFQEDLALAVAARALELVQVLGLDL